MKIKSFILTMAACAGLFTACSNEIDEVVDNNSNQETKAEAYLSVSFTMPSSGLTRATGGETGDGPEEGTREENKVTDVDLYLFGMEGDEITTLGLKKHIGHGDITGNQSESTYTTNPVQVEIGKYAVYVVVNQPQNGNDNINSIAIGASLEDFQAKVFSVAQKTGEYCTDNHFLMTNAYTIGRDKGQGLDAYKEGVVNIVDENKTPDLAAKVTVSVERAAARIDFLVNKTDNRYDVINAKDEKIASVTINSYKVINTRNSAWFLKRVSTDSEISSLTVGGDETPNEGVNTNYVVENLFDFKNSISNFTTEYYTANYSRKFNTYVAWKKITEKNTDEKQVMAYCMENTQPKAKQVIGLTTTVIFRAKYIPEPNAIIGTIIESDKSFYRFKTGSTLYANLTEVFKAKYNKASDDAAYDAAIEAGIFGLSKEGWEAAEKDSKSKLQYVSETTKGTTQAGFYEKDIEKFVNGNCYYTVMLRHSDNNDPNASGIMEFATVRNNIYKVKINSISSLGEFTSGTPGPADPEKPGEGREDEENGKDGSNPEIPGETDTEDPEPSNPVFPIDPETPDESLKTFLKAEILISDWTLRTNDIDL